MEHFLFRKVELWIVFLILIIGFVAAVVFGWLALAHSRGSPDVGHLGSIAGKLAGIPDTIIEIATAIPPQRSPASRFPHHRGFVVSSDEASFNDPGYLLLSHFDDKAERYVVDLVRLSDKKTIWRYAPDITQINARSHLDPHWLDLARDKAPDRYRMTHPYLMDDGGLVFQDSSPLVRINACSQIEWTLDGVYHHSIEMGPDGNFWIPSQIWPSSVKGTDPTYFIDDALAKVSPSGKLLWQKSVAAILTQNHMRWMVAGISPYSNDMLHLNDIQPVLSDGPHWRKGDLFVSLRHRSMVFLYRPSTNKIIWHKEGPWLLQHDVDILDDHRISVFDNNAAITVNGPAVDGTNDLLVYDFDTGKVTDPYQKAFRKKDIRTVTEGRGTILDNGDAFVEETDYGRALRLTPGGESRWTYFSTSPEGRNSKLGWSRYISAKDAKPALAAIANAKCEVH